MSFCLVFLSESITTPREQLCNRSCSNKHTHHRTVTRRYRCAPHRTFKRRYRCARLQLGYDHQVRQRMGDARMDGARGRALRAAGAGRRGARVDETRGCASRALRYVRRERWQSFSTDPSRTARKGVKGKKREMEKTRAGGGGALSGESASPSARPSSPSPLRRCAG
jgi:hypothetical protein